LIPFLSSSLYTSSLHTPVKRDSERQIHIIIEINPNMLDNPIALLCTGLALILALFFLLGGDSASGGSNASSTVKDRQVLADEINALYAEVESSTNDDGKDGKSDTKSKEEKPIEVEIKKSMDVVKEASVKVPVPKEPVLMPQKKLYDWDKDEREDEYAAEIKDKRNGLENFQLAEKLFTQEKYLPAAKYYWISLQNLIRGDEDSSKPLDYSAIFKQYMTCYDRHYKSESPQIARCQAHLYIAKSYTRLNLPRDALSILKVAQTFDPNNVEAMALAAHLLKKSGMKPQHELVRLINVAGQSPLVK